MDYETILSYLKCTKCNSSDLIVSFRDSTTGDYKDEFIECRNCQNRYPIISDMIVTEPSLMGIEKTGVKDKDFKSTFKSYSDWWLKVNKGIGHRQDIELLFKEHTGRDKEFLTGKSVLDAGCGGGRFLTYVSQAVGSTVVAFDLGYGLMLAKEKNKNVDNIIYVQGNILNPPFRDGVFDFIYSFGVLMTTPDPKKSFSNLSNLLKIGGHLAVYLYYRPHLTFREWGAKYVIAQMIKFLYREPIRRFIASLSHGLILLFSRVIYYRGPILKFLSKHPITKPLAHALDVLLPPSVYKPKESKEHNIVRNYDHYSTKYNFLHSNEEILLWYQESNFNNIEIRKLPVTMIGEKQNFFSDPISVSYSCPSLSMWEEIEAKGIEKS